MENNIMCPHCEANLSKRDSMYREVRVEDTEWYGIENNEIVYCNLSPSQAAYCELICTSCGKSIEDYIGELINTEVLKGEI